MRRFVTLLVLLLVSVPFGISLSGCGKKNTVTFCNASGSGPVVGQLNTIVLQPQVYGLSLNYGQIGQISTPTATDCKGSPVSISTFTYSSKNMSIVDINPANGAICAGTWNRNLNVIPDFTVCTPPSTPDPNNSVTFVSAEANGVVSNSIPVFTHPVVTNVVLGQTSTNCSVDQTTDCCPLVSNNAVSAPIYNENSCLSQGNTGQLSARVFAGTGTYDPTTGKGTGTLSNISCQAGHLTFTPQTTGIVTIDQNGVATAVQPGSTLITANIANASSSAGFFATCPPKSITLSVPNQTSTNVTVGQNFSQPLVATVLDTNNRTLTGLTLEYVSTTPNTIPAASGGTITPSFAGAASITAICQPPSCNPAPINQIGLLGNGKPITSNQVNITTPGTNSTFLYIASTQSRYLVPVDFTQTTIGAPIQLPYVPNSMVISQDGTSIYMGSSTELMVFSATTNGITREDTTVPGTVLAVSPDNTQVVIADANRKKIYIESTSGGTGGTGGTATTPTVTSQIGWSGTGTPRAAWTPDSQTLYVADPGAASVSTAASTNTLLVYTTFTGWTPASTPAAAPLDVAITVPSIGAYLAGASTNAVGYCPLTTTTTVNGQSTTTNLFFPEADSKPSATDRVATTNDGFHVLGASATGATLTDLHLSLPSSGTACPLADGAGLAFTSAATTTPLSGVTPTAITSVLPSTDSSVAAVTYTGTGSVVPVYTPVANNSATAGTLTNVPLTGTATAPVAGVWSSDNLTLFAGTSGDNQVHLITRTSTTTPLTDSRTIAPKLPVDTSVSAPAGSFATPNLIVQRPRRTT